jgi:hypothetical protein
MESLEEPGGTHGDTPIRDLRGLKREGASVWSVEKTRVSYKLPDPEGVFQHIREGLGPEEQRTETQSAYFRVNAVRWGL